MKQGPNSFYMPSIPLGFSSSFFSAAADNNPLGGTCRVSSTRSEGDWKNF